MLLKRIEAKTLPEAIERVRTECGADALVVETRPTRDGFLVVASKPEPEVTHRDQAGSASFLSKWTRGFRPMAEKATDFGLSKPILQAVERALLGTKVELARPGDPALPNLASRVMAALIHQEPRFESADGFRTVALVGPTGVGKTTTLAKLAARAKERGERVAIITLDTYRMAAVEQLRSFAELLDVPFSVALSTQDVRRVIDENQFADRIYIDTIGKSPRSRESLPTLQRTLRAADAHTLLATKLIRQIADSSGWTCKIIAEAIAREDRDAFLGPQFSQGQDLPVRETASHAGAGANAVIPSATLVERFLVKDVFDGNSVLDFLIAVMNMRDGTHLYMKELAAGDPLIGQSYASLVRTRHAGLHLVGWLPVTQRDTLRNRKGDFDFHFRTCYNDKIEQDTLQQGDLLVFTACFGIWEGGTGEP